MIRIRPLLLLSLVALAAGALPAGAQNGGMPVLPGLPPVGPPVPRAHPPAAPPPAALPNAQATDQMRNLDFLFEALKVAPDEASAKAIEERIWAVWLVSKSDTTNLLMTRAKTAIEAQDLDLALKLLDAVVETNPGYAEGWNRRSTVYFMKKEYGRAMSDIRETLALEPRQYEALAGLGMILQDIGDEKRALQAFRMALALNPHMDRIPDLVKQLTEKVEGRDI